MCGGARKLARADFVVTFLANPDMESCCDACGDRLEQGDEIEFCGRKKRLSQQEPGTLISCHVFICNSCVASCSEGDRLERVWEKVKGANGKTSWCAAKPPGKHVSAPDPDASQSEDSDSQSADSRSEDPQPVEQVPVLAQHSAGDSAPAPASEQALLSLADFPADFTEDLQLELAEESAVDEAQSKLVGYLHNLHGVGGPGVQASEVASFLWTMNREWRQTQGGGNCLFWAFLSALAAQYPDVHKQPTKAIVMKLRNTIATLAGNGRLQAVMAKGSGLWQRSSSSRGDPADDRPKEPAGYPKFIKRDGEWGNQFDMALLAWQLALSGVTTPQRRLISVEPSLWFRYP